MRRSEGERGEASGGRRVRAVVAVALLAASAAGAVVWPEEPAPEPDAWVAAERRKLERAIGLRDPVGVRAAADALVELANAEAIDVIVEVGLLSNNPDVEAIMQDVLARVPKGPALTRVCHHCNHHPKPAVRDQLTGILALIRNLEAYTALLTSLHDKHDPVVFAALEGIRLRNDLGSVAHLIEALRREEDDGFGQGALAHGIRATLEALTNYDLETSERWRTFWAVQEKGFKRRSKAERERAEKEAEPKDEARTGVLKPKKRKPVPQFFGLELLSQRIVFILDVSMSMKEADPPPKVEGEDTTGWQKDRMRVRLYRVQTELTRLLNEMTEDTQFTIIAFNNKVSQLSGTLMPATMENKLIATRYLESFGASGETWTDRALEAAFKVPNAHTFVLLSDGAPVRNEVVIHVPTILEWLERENRFRRIVIHTVGFAGTKDSIGDFLREVARLTKGQYRQLE